MYTHVALTLPHALLMCPMYTALRALYYEYTVTATAAALDNLVSVYIRV